MYPTNSTGTTLSDYKSYSHGTIRVDFYPGLEQYWQYSFPENFDKSPNEHTIAVFHVKEKKPPTIFKFEETGVEVHIDEDCYFWKRFKEYFPITMASAAKAIALKRFATFAGIEISLIGVKRFRNGKEY